MKLTYLMVFIGGFKQSCEVLIYHQSLHFLLYLHFWYDRPNAHIALVLEVKEQSLLLNIAPSTFLT